MNSAVMKLFVLLLVLGILADYIRRFFSLVFRTKHTGWYSLLVFLGEVILAAVIVRFAATWPDRLFGLAGLLLLPLMACTEGISDRGVLFRARGKRFFYPMKIRCDSGIVAGREEGKWLHDRSIRQGGQVRAFAQNGRLLVMQSHKKCSRGWMLR